MVSNRKGFSSLLALGAVSILLFQGCVATRNWVRERIDPLASRVSESESRLGQVGGRLDGTESRLTEVGGRIDGMEGKLGTVDEKAENALARLGKLRLHRQLVLDMKEGAQFRFGSNRLTDQARQEIEGFFSDLKGELGDMESAVFLVTGHTDSVGSEDYNYELGRRRAESVARYLVLQKSLNPMQVMAVSYGKSTPVADNSTPQGRGKNRRVEILVYKEAIDSGVAEGKTSAGEQLSSSQASVRNQ